LKYTYWFVVAIKCSGVCGWVLLDKETFVSKIYTQVEDITTKSFQGY